MKQVIIFGLFLFFIGCKQNKQDDMFIENRLKDISLAYNDDLKKTGIPYKFTNHFPSEITSLPIKMHPNIEVSEECIYNMLFEFNVKKSKIDSITTVLENKHISKYLPSDSNLIVIKRKILRKENYKEINVTPPIPFFETYSFSNSEDVVTIEDVYDETTKSGLSKDFKIYVLESEKGKYWEGLESADYMPKEWENGYSKGIAINEKNNIIIYWVIIW